MSNKFIDINTGLGYDEVPTGKVQPLIVKGQPVTEEAYDAYYNQNPTELPSVTVEPDKSTTLAAYYDRMANASPSNFVRHLNTQYEDDRLRRANHWLGIPNMLSPSLYIGAGIDYFQGEQPFWNGVWYGNSGIVSDEFAYNNPRAAALSNFAFDLAVPFAIAKGGRALNSGIRYLREPVDFETGAETSRVYKPHRYSSRVYKEGLDPEHVQLKNRVPETLEHVYEGETPDGSPVYSLQAVAIPEELDPVKLVDLIRRINRKNYSSLNYDLTDILDFQGPYNTVTDVRAGNIGEVGGKYYIIDPSVLSNADYEAIMMRKGGSIRKFSSGNKIHIKKLNEGKFTEYCDGKVTQECINKGKNSSDPKVRKRATFADNVRKWSTGGKSEDEEKEDKGKVEKGIEDLSNVYNSYQDGSLWGINFPVYGDVSDLIFDTVKKNKYIPGPFSTLETIGGLANMYTEGINKDNAKDVILNAMGVHPATIPYGAMLLLISDLSELAAKSNLKAQANKTLTLNLYTIANQHPSALMRHDPNSGKYYFTYTSYDPNNVDEEGINVNTIVHEGIPDDPTVEQANEYLTKESRKKHGK